MRIGIDARTTQGRFTGDATYWRGLIEGLADLDLSDDILLYTDASLPKPELKLSGRMQIRPLRARNWRVWSALAFPRALQRDQADLAHVQYTIPPRMPCPVVTTVHDISFKRLPEFFSFKDRMILNWGMRYARKRAAGIIAVSEFTKSEIVDLYHIDPAKITVTYEAADEQFKPLDRDEARKVVESRYGIASPFLLTLGVIQPRKNLKRLLEGLARLKEGSRLDRKLVIVGKYGWKEESLLHKIEELKLTGDVVLTGYVPYEDLPIFYNAAEVFVYPSVYEGFGLPPLEAMACGTPVITGNKSSLPEVVGDAGIMVDPYDPPAFGNAIENVLGDERLRAEMSARGLTRASGFSWDKMAGEVLGVYRKYGKQTRNL